MADLTRSRLLDEKELAALLGVSVSTVRNWRYTYQGPPVQNVGRSVRYDLAECEAWLAEQKHPFWRGQWQTRLLGSRAAVPAFQEQGITNMAFNVKVEDFEVLPEGTYDATFVDIEECESANPAFAGGYWKWEFEILRDGEPRRMTANSSAKLTRMTKAGAWVRAIRGRPVDAREDFSFGAIRGRPCRLVLTIEDTKVGQFNGIDEILPPTKEQAQQRVPVSQAPSDAPF